MGISYRYSDQFDEFDPVPNAEDALKARSSETCWSSSMAMSKASGLRVSSSLASGSTGIQIVMASSRMPAAYSGARDPRPRPVPKTRTRDRLPRRSSRHPDAL